MIGKVKVTVKNPPCVACGGMDGYHYPTCDRKKLDVIADVVLRYRPKAKAKASKQRQKRKAKRDAKKG